MLCEIRHHRRELFQVQLMVPVFVERLEEERVISDRCCVDYPQSIDQTFLSEFAQLRRIDFAVFVLVRQIEAFFADLLHPRSDHYVGILRLHPLQSGVHRRSTDDHRSGAAAQAAAHGELEDRQDHDPVAGCAEVCS